MEIVLASQSPYRRALLEQIGLTFKAVAPRFNEDDLKNNGKLSVTELCRQLAWQKAKSLASEYPNAILIGSDQMVQLAQSALGKPKNAANAILQLTRMQGQTHELITSVCVLFKMKKLEHTDVTRITLRKLSPQQIADYVDYEKPFDVAGSYKLEKAGITLVENIVSNDQSSVIGLPLIALTNFLIELGVPFPFRQDQGDK